MNKVSKTDVLNRIAEQAVPDTLDLWPEIRSRVEAAPSPRSSMAGRASTGMSSHRQFMIGVAAAVLLALVVGATSPLWNPPEAVSAQAILDQAQSTAKSPMAVHTYHLQMTRQVPGKGGVTISTEIWFDGSDRQRSDEQVTDASGAIVSTSEVVFDGTQAWIAFTEQGQTRVVHTTGTTWTEPAEDPSRQNSLTDVLTQYSSPKWCMTAQLKGEASVADRATYLIAVIPKPGGCATRSGGMDESKVRVAQSDVQRTLENQDVQMLVWVDKLSYLPLKTEVRNASGVVLDQSEVTNVQYNVALPDSIFSYTPPPGVSVFNFTGGTGADVKKALCSAPPTGKCQPSKKP